MMTALWSALAAVGAGLILFAVAAGLPIAAAVPLVVLALLHLAYAVAALRAGRLPFVSTALGAAAGCFAIDLALLFTGATGVVPFAALLVLHWGIALAAALHLRGARAADAQPATLAAPAPVAASTASEPSRPTRTSRPGTWIVRAACGAALVALVTTPALAQTAPGAVAVPHGEMHGDGHGSSHHGH